MRPTGRAVCAFLIVSLALGSFAFGLAQSQSTSTHSTEVRIAARLLDDDRVEFAIQHREGGVWGERQLVDGRYLDTRTATRNAWSVTSPYTVHVAPAESFLPPDTFPGWHEEPLSPNAIGSSGHHTNGWFVVQVPMAAGGDLFASCKPESGVVFARTGKNGAWSAVTAERLIEMSANARHIHGRAMIAGEVTENCNVDSRSVLFPGTGKSVWSTSSSDAQPQAPSQQTGPPDWEPFAHLEHGQWSQMEEDEQVHGLGHWSVWQIARSGGSDEFVACRAGRGELQAKTGSGEWSAITAEGIMDRLSFAPWYYTISALQGMGQFCKVPVSHLTASLVPGAEQQQQAQQTEPEPEGQLSFREIPGTPVSATLRAWHGGAALNTLALTCTLGETTASMSVLFATADEHYSPRQDRRMYGYFRSPEQQVFSFIVHDDKSASLEHGMALLHAAIKEENSGISFKVRVPSGERGFFTLKFAFSPTLRDQLRRCLTQIEWID